MTKTKRRRFHAYRPASKRSTAANRVKRAAHRRSKTFRLWTKRLLIAAIALLCLPIAARVYVHYSVQDRVYSDISKVPHCRVAMVLGAWVRPNGSLCESLETRVNKAIALYKAGKCEKLLMSGDNRFKNYNEPERMRDYAIKKGVPAQDIALDYAGRRTYDSVYRARHIFGQRKMIVVTQSFHLDRAIFLCKHLGVDAYGLKASAVTDPRASIRECPACLNAIADVYLLHPHPVMGKKEKI